MPVTPRMWFWIWVSFIGFGALALFVGDSTGIFTGLSLGAATWIVLHPLLTAVEKGFKRFKAYRVEKNQR